MPLMKLLAVVTVFLLVPESIAAGGLCDEGYVIQPEDVFAVVGQTVQMHCQYMLSAVEWERGGIPIYDSDEIFVHSNNTLQFNSVVPDDFGTYTCLALIGFSQAVRCSAELREAESPFIANMTGPGASDNDTQTLSALVTGSPTPSTEWKRNGIPLSLADSRFENPSTVEGQGVRVTLTITMVTAADRGIYELVARNNFGNFNESWEVRVSFLELNDLEKMYNGSTNITYTCSGRVYPREGTTVVWMRGTNQLVDQLQTKITFNESSLHYDIYTSVTVDLSTCQAEPEVVKCIVSYGADRLSVERNDTICQPYPSSPPTPSITNQISNSMYSSTMACVSSSCKPVSTDQPRQSGTPKSEETPDNQGNSGVENTIVGTVIGILLVVTVTSVLVIMLLIVLRRHYTHRREGIHPNNNPIYPEPELHDDRAKACPPTPPSRGYRMKLNEASEPSPHATGENDNKAFSANAYPSASNASSNCYGMKLNEAHESCACPSTTNDDDNKMACPQIEAHVSLTTSNETHALQHPPNKIILPESTADENGGCVTYDEEKL